MVDDQTENRSRVSRKGKTVVSKKGKMPVKQKSSKKNQRRTSRPSLSRKRSASTSSESSGEKIVKSKKKRTSREIVEQSSSSEEFSSEDPGSDIQLEEEGVTRMPGTIPLVPMTSHVSQKTKAKIISGEFININSLLPNLFEVEDDEKKKMN